MSEIYDYINDLVSGFRPMRRTNPQQGQSEWYYMDDQGENDDISLPDMPTVDVVAQNIPNPLFQRQSNPFIKNGMTPLEQNQTAYNPNLQSYAWGDSVFSSQPTSQKQMTAPSISSADQEFFKRVIPQIIDQEGVYEHTYIDTTGHKTIGVGANIDDWNNFQKVNWLSNGQAASPEDVLAEFNRFQQLIHKGEYGQGKTADGYEQISKLKISADEIKRLLMPHLQDDLQELRLQIPEYDTLPDPLRDVLLDIKFNVGNVSPDNWPKLHKAIKARNLTDIRANVHRKKVGEKRNKWAEDQIDKITGWGKWTD